MEATFVVHTVAACLFTAKTVRPLITIYEKKKGLFFPKNEDENWVKIYVKTD